MATHNLEVSTENLLNAVVQMPENEFNKFVETARTLRNRQKTSIVSGKEAEVILKINTVFSLEERKRYNELYARFQRDELTQAEYKELLELSDKFEVQNAKRLEYLGELAQMRNRTLEEVMQDLGMKPAHL